MKVLIFDDDMLARNDLKQIFRLHGVAAVSTGDQRRALSLMASGACNLVIAGVSQYAEGIPAFIRAARSTPGRLPIIVGAAHRAETMHLRTISAYVDFPIFPRDLSRIVQAAVTNASTRAVSIIM